MTKSELMPISGILSTEQLITRLADIELEDANPDNVDYETAAARLQRWLEGFRRNASANTYKTYKLAIDRFLGACNSVGVVPMPITASNMIKVLNFLVDVKKVKLSTIRVTCTAANNLHEAAGYPRPTLNKQVQVELDGIRRKLKEAKRQVPALTKEHRDQIVEAYLEEGSLRSIRDACMVSVAFDCLLRRSEVADIKMGHVFERREELTEGVEPDKLLPLPFPYRSQEKLDGRLFIPVSKTDQYGEGQSLYLSPDSVRLISYMIEQLDLETDDKDAYLFRGIQNSGFIEDKLSHQGVYRAMQKMSKVAGADAMFAGHSCRIGACMLLSKMFSLTEVMKAGRWVSPAMPAYYNRNEEVYQGAVARFHKSDLATFKRY